MSVTLVDRRKEWAIPLIEKRAGMKFERIGAPQPQDMAKAATDRAVQDIRVRPDPQDFKTLLAFPPFRILCLDSHDLWPGLRLGLQ